jgi:hypothetical protein
MIKEESRFASSTVFEGMTSIRALIDNLKNNVENARRIKEILFDLYLFEREFNKELYPNNEIIILDKNEEYEPPFDIPELELQIGNYIKRLYIISDSGEGLIVYLKTKENDND